MSWCLVKHPNFCWDEIMAWEKDMPKARALDSMYSAQPYGLLYITFGSKEMVCFIKGEFMLKKKYPSLDQMGKQKEN